VAASAPASSSASLSASPTISGTTPTSAGTGSATSADVIATHVRATTRAFIDDLNIALATGDVTKIEALTSPTCGCRSLVNTIKQRAAKDQRFDGVAFTLKSIDAVNFLAAGASVEISYSISAGHIVDRGGNQVETEDATPDGLAEVFVSNINGRWIVYQNVLLGTGNV
jgi:hypothetical protein